MRIFSARLLRIFEIAVCLRLRAISRSKKSVTASRLICCREIRFTLCVSKRPAISRGANKLSFSLFRLSAFEKGHSLFFALELSSAFFAKTCALFICHCQSRADICNICRLRRGRSLRDRQRLQVASCQSYEQEQFRGQKNQFLRIFEIAVCLRFAAVANFCQIFYACRLRLFILIERRTIQTAQMSPVSVANTYTVI